jgi:hypothetical protein
MEAENNERFRHLSDRLLVRVPLAHHPAKSLDSVQRRPRSENQQSYQSYTQCRALNNGRPISRLRSCPGKQIIRKAYR